MSAARALLALLWPLLVAGASAGDPAPEFRLCDLEGREQTLAGLRRGGALVLEFGSVYCASCQEALRQLEGLRRARGGSGPAVAVINVDPPGAEKVVRAVVAGIRAGYPVLRDADGAAAESYGVTQIPWLVEIDAAGIIRSVHQGLPEDLAGGLRLDEPAPPGER